MFKKYRFIFLTLMLLSYFLLYIATSVDRNYICDIDCERMLGMDTILRKNRDYIYYTARCNRPVVSDSICVYVKDTSGIDWNLLADTTCQVATNHGLLQQKVFIIKINNTSIPDTVAKVQCP